MTGTAHCPEGPRPRGPEPAIEFRAYPVREDADPPDPDANYARAISDVGYQDGTSLPIAKNH